MWKTILAGALLLLAAPAFAAGGDVPADAKDVEPMLIGETVPDVTVRTMEGKEVSLLAKVKSQPTVLIFYRGGWCPYCNKQLAGLLFIEPDLADLGYQILAISPDRPEKLKESEKAQKLNYELFSDSDVEAARAFGLAFKVSDELIEKYKGYGIDLDDASGKGHHILPVPAAYVVNTDGVIEFAYVNPNYRTRINPQLLLSAAKYSGTKEEKKK